MSKMPDAITDITKMIDFLKPGDVVEIARINNNVITIELSLEDGETISFHRHES